MSDDPLGVAFRQHHHHRHHQHHLDSNLQASTTSSITMTRHPPLPMGALDGARVAGYIRDALALALWQANVPEWSSDFEAHLFGSREYGLNTPTSDGDFFMVLPAEVLPRRLEILHLVSACLEKGGYALGDRDNRPIVQESNSTVKWIDVRSGLPVSVLLADDASCQQSLQATVFLKLFLREHGQWQAPLCQVITRLRQDGILNAHGRDAVVGARLKTAPFPMFC